jgi:cytochrome b-561
LVLMFLYTPSVERAYWTVKDIEFVITFGWFLRGLHRIAAHLMVAVVFLHLIRVFLTGSYKNGLAADANRPVNWIVGILLFILTLLLSFTGYLLPWDQLAFWAITVGTNIAKAAPVVGEFIRYLLLGGNDIEQSTLLRFYVLHCFFLPLIVMALISYHMWRIRKDGGLACIDQQVKKTENKMKGAVKTKTYSLLGIAKGTTANVVSSLALDEEDSVDSSPNMIRRISVVILLTLIVSSILTFIFNAPLEEAANPFVTPNPAKAPWYFLWLQELVTITTFHIGDFTINGAFVGGIIIPGILVTLGIAWPYLDKSPIEAAGVWFHRSRRWQNIVFMIIIGLVLVLTFVGTFMRGPYWELFWPWETWPLLPKLF